jgi:hypothetical protein
MTPNSAFETDAVQHSALTASLNANVGQTQ